MGLRELNVSYNRLSRVPPELGNCENLERLELTGNHLSELPFEVRQNDLSSPKQEIIWVTHAEKDYLVI